MLFEIVFGLVFWTLGVFYIVYAYRDPPAAVERFFRIPDFFIFFPERNRVKLGRITAGAFCLVAGGVIVSRELYRLIFCWWV